MYLSLDQSSNKTGWAVFNDEKELIDYGVINLSSMPSKTEEDQAEKRAKLLRQLDVLIYKYHIMHIICEGIYSNHNVHTHEILSKFHGCIFDYSMRRGIICFSFPCAGSWRKHLGIKARKKVEYKLETKRYVINRYKLDTNLIEDIYDAVAIGTAYFIK